jgi:hypothetical protein
MSSSPELTPGRGEVVRMETSLVTRRQILIGAGAVGAAGALSPLLVPVAVSAGNGGPRGALIKWDLITVVSGVVLPGGTNVATDETAGPAFHQSYALTGSGLAERDQSEASGGGTFVHKAADGTTVIDHGIYYVTGFNSFGEDGGSLAGLGLIDGIGEINDTDGGVLSLAIKLIPTSGSPYTGVLVVNCAAPGNTHSLSEGITLTIGSNTLVQDPTLHGSTLFHLLASG